MIRRLIVILLIIVVFIVPLSVLAFEYDIDEESGLKLYELPNGVKDEIINGKYIKRVSDIVNAWELTWLLTNGEETDDYYGIHSADLNMGPPYVRHTVYMSKGTRTSSFTNGYHGVNDLVYYDLGYGANIRYKIPKCAFVEEWTLAETQAWLEKNQVKIIYQLETPEVYNIEPIKGHHKVKLLINEFSLHIKNIAIAISKTVTEFFYDGEAITARGILFFAYVATVFCLSVLAIVFKRR